MSRNASVLIVTGKFTARLSGGMNIFIDIPGQGFTDAINFLKFLNTGASYFLLTTKISDQIATLGRTNAGDFIQKRACTLFPSPLAMGSYSKAMGFITNML